MFTVALKMLFNFICCLIRHALA